MKKEKSKMILNNRPMVENLNKQNEAYRTHSEKNLNIYTVFLCALCVIIAVLFFVGRSWLFGLGFLLVGALLAVMAYFSYRNEKREREAKERAKNAEHPEAIFKDHDE